MVTSSPQTCESNFNKNFDLLNISKPMLIYVFTLGSLKVLLYAFINKHLSRLDIKTKQMFYFAMS